MASEWYVEDDDRAIGPFTVAQMKAQAVADRIRPETRVRKGRRGKWIAARQVKGLLHPRDVAETNPGRVGATRPDVQVNVDEDGTFLAPLRHRKRRGIIYVALVVFILIGQSAMHQQLFFDITVGLILGSYPVVQIKKRTIEQTIVVFFLPVHTRTWKLRDFVAVETDVEPRITDAIGCLVLFFFWFWFLFRLFDHLVPWLGGNYKLFLRQYDDERMLIWQGNNTADFEANLDLLQSVGLPIG